MICDTINVMAKAFEENMKQAFLELVESGLDAPFDLYARDPEDYSFMNEIFPNFQLLSAGGAMPFQAHGLVAGYPFYYRSEQHSADIREAPVGHDFPWSNHNAYWTATMDANDYSGSENFFPQLIWLLKNFKKSPFLYRFPCKKLAYRDSNDLSSFYVVEGAEDEVYGWGYNPEEAFLEAQKISAYLAERGITEEQQKALFRAKEVSKTPEEYDLRIYEAELPTFLL